MRVIAGQKKGFPLKSPKGDMTRPTSDKIKGSIFNMISIVIDFNGKKAMDCFAGTGSLGIEFLSWGGDHCTFVDTNISAYKIINDNIIKTGYQKQAKVIKGSIFSVLKQKTQYDVFFIDPPYSKGLAQKTISTVQENDLLNDNGIVIVETDVKENIEYDASYFEFINEKKYGDTMITILKRS